MSEYVINGEKFKNKNEITERCRKITKKYFDKKVSGKDLKFIKALFKFHPHSKEKLKNIDYIYVAIDSYNENPCFWIRKKDGFFDDISFYKCIKHIPFSEDKKMDYKFMFGKYKGKSIYDIDDNDYLTWLRSQKWLDRGSKVKIGQFLRFGYIPFNPVAFKAELEKKKSKY